MTRNDARAHRRVDLDPVEALRLLGSVSLGRIVFTRQALPTVRPVSHVLDDGDIVIRTHEGAELTAQPRQGGGEGVVVAYEADALDPDTHLGWSVVVTGYARLVTDPADLARIRTRLTPWSPQEGMDHAVRINPCLITGVLLTDTAATASRYGTVDAEHRPASRPPGSCPCGG
ncbi:pyridoxamine 5'-phosphate oxidase family protein [Streptomyces sp. NPDC049099]|uniref:pyridoxamine 5'-phosphate oxidase family protein n=1 Tax=Streptomyces sp. NPDC049099 TaxID=3155768 RepID=UPI0034371031